MYQVSSTFIGGWSLCDAVMRVSADGTLAVMTESAAELRRLTLIGDIIRLLDSGEEQVTSGMLQRDAADDDERAALSADVRALRDQGLMSLDERYSGAWVAHPTRAGHDAWQEFSARRDDTVQRQKHLRNDYLRWLYDQTRGGHYAVADHYLDANRTFLGSPFTRPELGTAGAWLEERGFIEGPGAHGRPDPLRARPTARGVDWIEDGRDVHDQKADSGSTNYTFHAPAQVAHGSQYVVQMQTNSSGAQGAQELAQMLDQLAQGLPADAAGQLSGLAEALRDEAQGDTRTSRFRELGDAVTKAFTGGVGGAIGKGLLDHVNTWIASLS